MLLAALLAGACSPRPPDPQALDRALGRAVALLPLYRALATLEAGRPAPNVALLQVGDSHTANDAFSGRMRELFQARFGDGGRGLLPPAIPFRYYRPQQISVSAEGWQLVGSANAASAGPFGITGLRQRASGPARMTVATERGGGLARVRIEALGQPGGGTLDVAFDGGAVSSFATEAGVRAPIWLVPPSDETATVLDIFARGDGPVELMSVMIERTGGGVTYSNLGTIGATVELTTRWDFTVVAAELARLRPALIVIAFGTNEGFRDATDPKDYRVLFRDRIAALHAAAPDAAVIIAGPPDGSRSRRASPNGAPCPIEPGARTAWVVPPRLPEIRQVQREAAGEAGFYFWDWSEAMGGACSMQDWARTDPPKAAPDHVHLFAPGYRATAEALFAEIIRGYDSYRALAGTS